MHKITPCLWFDGTAEEAVEFYTSIFPNSAVDTVIPCGEACSRVSGQPVGSVLSITFTLAGQPFIAINGGPEFQFSPAVSFHTLCATQAEIDELWDKLAEGGQPLECGWVTDRYGVTWQVVPRVLEELLEKGGEGTERMMEAMFGMVKLDGDKLERAYHGS